MPSTSTNNCDPSSLFSIARSIFSSRHDKFNSTEANNGYDSELESFQKQVTDQLHELSLVSSNELLSIEWTMKLLNSYILFQEEFKLILLKNKSQILRPPLNHLLRDFFERSLKALDICNATRDGIERMRIWQKHVDIVLSALDSPREELSKGQILRARKALMDLALAMVDEKQSDSSVLSRGYRSFGRNNNKSKFHQEQASRHSRSLSWSVSSTWSASKKLQAIANNLVPPRENEIVATNGIAFTLFTVSCVLIFVLWSLVAGIPCQDRGVYLQFSFPRNVGWGVKLVSLHERIVAESKKRNSSGGLLKEICRIEKCASDMADLVDHEFPLTEETKMALEERREELVLVSEDLRNGLDPLQRQVREVFRRIIVCRNEGLEVLEGAGK